MRPVAESPRRGAERAGRWARDKLDQVRYKQVMRVPLLSMNVLALIAGAVWAVGCGGRSAQPGPDPVAAARATEKPPVPVVATIDPDAYTPKPVEHRGLVALFSEHWSWRMEREPVRATTLGDRRFDAELPAIAHGYVLQAERDRRALLERARMLSDEKMSLSDRLSLDMFIQMLEGRIGTELCQSHLWSVSARNNPVAWANALPRKHKVVTVEDSQNLLSRYQTLNRYINDTIANLQLGISDGKVADAEAARRTLALVEGELAKPMARWTLLDPIRDLSQYQQLSPAQREQFAADLKAVVADWVKPAFVRYRDFLRDVIVPAGRTGKQVGVGSLPDGWACYRALVRRHLAIDQNPIDLHRLGREQIASINQEMRELGGRLFDTDDLDEIIERLRTDKSLYFTTSDEILSTARAAVSAAKAKMPEYFGVLPQADCEVVPIPDYAAPFTTIAYYNGPYPDGSKPGEYFINTYKPALRPRFEMQVLAYHEAIPGHHLQIALASEQSALPAFRRHYGSTAFVEGWALYTERLADEMGLYSADLDRMGMLSYDAWRAARLVVDTGIHAMGWTREQAEAYMRDHTALTEANIKNEVDRYITTPGQAVAYKVGQLAIWRLRREAEEALGQDFDLKRFHDTVLQNGAITLPALETIVAAWIAIEKAAIARRAAEANAADARSDKDGEDGDGSNDGADSAPAGERPPQTADHQR
ncbi:MAG: hypothetical protein Tsb0020_51670 [Haliangiales bacterium]